MSLNVSLPATTDAGFARDVLAAETPVLVDFTADWCPPCKMISPIYTQLSDKYSGIAFSKVDVDQVGDAAAEQRIRSIPTFQFYKDGKQVNQVTTDCTRHTWCGSIILNLALSNPSNFVYCWRAQLTGADEGAQAAERAPRRQERRQDMSRGGTVRLSHGRGAGCGAGVRRARPQLTRAGSASRCGSAARSGSRGR